MKKFAGRILALIVALSMLLVPAAFAAERNAASVSVGNFVITMGEETIEIPAYLTLNGGLDLAGLRGYLTANVSTESATALSALAAFENGEIKAYLNGMKSGIIIPMEQLLALLEEEMGMSLEELLAEAMSEVETALPAEAQEALTSLMESAAALENIESVDPEALLKALNVTISEGEACTETLFDVEAECTEYYIAMAPATLKATMDALGAAVPELGAFYAEYFAMMNDMMAESGEEMTVEQALEMVTLGFDAVLCLADCGMNLYTEVSASVEGETVVLPFNFLTLTDDNGTYNEFTFDMPVDGEGLYLDIYTDDFADEEGAFKNLVIDIAIYDVETTEAETEMYLQLYSADVEEGLNVGLDVAVTDEYTDASFGISHLCHTVTDTEASTSYDGYLYAYISEGDEVIDITMDTNLTLTSVPEGELLTFTNSVNPLEADEEAMEALGNDAASALMSGLSVLMEDPAIASLIASFN